MTADMVRARPPTSNLELLVASPAFQSPKAASLATNSTYGTQPLNVEVYLPPISTATMKLVR